MKNILVFTPAILFVQSLRINNGGNPMNKSIKALAFAAIASIAFLACNDTPSASTGNDTTPPLKQVTPYDPPVLLIADDVANWMDSKSEEKRMIMISDMYMPEDTESSAGLSATIDSDGKVEYFLNGNKISAEDYSAKWIEYDGKRTDKGKRKDLTILGDIIYSDEYSWTVSITIEELAEFIKENDKLSISFYIEPTNDDV